MTGRTGDRACRACGAVFRRGFLRCPMDGAEVDDFRDDPLEGRVLLGRYAVERFIGGGANGRVYLARHVRLDRRFAVKVLYGDLAADPLMRSRFEREAEAASKLQHPNVVPVLDAELSGDGLCFMVMDFVDGPTLEARLAAEGPWPESRAADVLRQLAAGLAHAHAHGLVHRDLKPSNILFTAAGSVAARIADFGVAWAPTPGPGLTRPGDLVGTPGYMAPEQLTGRSIDGRTDLYALGMVGYRMLLGRHPFGGSEVELIDAALDRAVPPLSAFGVEAPGLEPLLRTLAARDPADRPASADAVAPALAARPVGGATEAPALAPAAALGRRRWWAAARGATAAILLALAGALGLGNGSSPHPPNDPRGAGGPTPTPSAAASPAAAGPELPPSSAPALPAPDATPDATAKTASTPAARGQAEASPAPSALRPPGPTSGRAASADRTLDRAPASRRRRSRRVAPAAERRGVPSTEATAPAHEGPPQGAPTVEELQRLYLEVGQRLDALAQAGQPEVERLKTRYFAVPFARALGEPGLRRPVQEQLTRIAREARRASSN